MEVLNKLQIVSKTTSKRKSFKILILDCKTHKNSFNGKILGLTLTEWLKFACQDCIIEICKFDEKSSVLDFAKNHIDTNYDFTLILLSKTPLIENTTIHSIMEYVEFKDVDVCKLPVGYVVKNKYLIASNHLTVDSVFSQNIEDFYTVESKVQFKYAFQILQERINNFHLLNGVELVNPNSTYIEPFVDIESGVVIYPNNSLKGNTTIASGVILKENNVIENSKIGNSSCISGSIIKDSVIAGNVYIKAFCEINNSLIGADSMIGNRVTINNYNVQTGSTIEPNASLGDTNDSDSGIR